MPSTPDLIVLHEHPEWQKPLFAALTRRGVSFEPFDVTQAAFSDVDLPRARAGGFGGVFRAGESGVAAASASAGDVERSACDRSDLGAGHRAFDLHRHDCDSPVEVILNLHRMRSHP